MGFSVNRFLICVFFDELRHEVLISEVFLALLHFLEVFLLLEPLLFGQPRFVAVVLRIRFVVR